MARENKTPKKANEILYPANESEIDFVDGRDGSSIPFDWFVVSFSILRVMKKAISFIAPSIFIGLLFLKKKCSQFS